MQAYAIVVVGGDHFWSSDFVIKSKENAIERAKQSSIEYRKILVTDQQGEPISGAPEYAVGIQSNEFHWIRAVDTEQSTEHGTDQDMQIQVRLVELVETDVGCPCPEHGDGPALEVKITDTIVWP